MDAYYKLDGIAIPIPDDLDIEGYKITKANRVASGLMKMELTALKSKFNLKYEILTGDEMDTIINILFTSQIYYTFEFLGNNDTVKSYTVYGGALKRTKALSEDGDWIWKNVSFSLIEQ